MPEYSKQTVVLLKQELDKRGLSKDGIKADLIKRLTEDDAKRSQSVEILLEDNNEVTTIEKPVSIEIDSEEKDVVAPSAAVSAIDLQVSATSALVEDLTVAPTTETVTSTTTEVVAPTPAEVEENEKEKYNRIVLELKKRISRSQRFNNTTDKEAEMALKRIEKFGIQAAGKILKTNQQLHDKPGHGGKRGNNVRLSNPSSRPIAAGVVQEDSEKLRKRKERFA